MLNYTYKHLRDPLRKRRMMMNQIFPVYSTVIKAAISQKTASGSNNSTGGNIGSYYGPVCPSFTLLSLWAASNYTNTTK